MQKSKLTKLTSNFQFLCNCIHSSLLKGIGALPLPLALASSPLFLCFTLLVWVSFLILHSSFYVSFFPRDTNQCTFISLHFLFLFNTDLFFQLSYYSSMASNLHHDSTSSSELSFFLSFSVGFEFVRNQYELHFLIS